MRCAGPAPARRFRVYRAARRGARAQESGLLSDGGAVRLMSPCWATYVVNATPDNDDAPAPSSRIRGALNSHPLARSLCGGCFTRACSLDQRISMHLHHRVGDTMAAMASARLMLPPPTLQCGMLMSAMTSMPSTVTLRPIQPARSLVLSLQHHKSVHDMVDPVPRFDPVTTFGMTHMLMPDGRRATPEFVQAMRARFLETLHAVPFDPSRLEPAILDRIVIACEPLNPARYAQAVASYACVRCARPLGASAFFTRCCTALACLACQHAVCRCAAPRRIFGERLEHCVRRL